MPVRLPLRDLGAPGWGEPWFPLRVVLLLSHASVWRCSMSVVCVCGSLVHAILIHLMMHKTSSAQPCRPGHNVTLPFFLVAGLWLVFVCFFLCWWFALVFCFVLLWLLFVGHCHGFTGLCIWSFTGTAIWTHLFAKVADQIQPIALINEFHAPV